MFRKDEKEYRKKEEKKQHIKKENEQKKNFLYQLFTRSYCEFNSKNGENEYKNILKKMKTFQFSFVRKYILGERKQLCRLDSLSHHIQFMCVCESLLLFSKHIVVQSKHILFIIFHLCLPIGCVCVIYIFFFSCLDDFIFFTVFFFFFSCCLEIRLIFSFCSFKLLSAYIAHLSYQRATGLQHYSLYSN